MGMMKKLCGLCTIKVRRQPHKVDRDRDYETAAAVFVEDETERKKGGNEEEEWN